MFEEYWMGFFAFSLFYYVPKFAIDLAPLNLSHKNMFQQIAALGVLISSMCAVPVTTELLFYFCSCFLFLFSHLLILYMFSLYYIFLGWRWFGKNQYVFEKLLKACLALSLSGISLPGLNWSGLLNVSTLPIPMLWQYPCCLMLRLHWPRGLWGVFRNSVSHHKRTP